MFKQDKRGFWICQNLSFREGIIHGFSGKKLGNMSLTAGLGGKRNRAKFLRFLNLQSRDLVQMEQIHQGQVRQVGKGEKGKVMAGIDGMVTDQKRVILGIKTADCLPILFYEPESKIIGVAHAGWKGILCQVVENVVKAMVKLGARPEKILAGIGPHIGGCCYTVLPERATTFTRKFGELEGMVYRERGKLHLDLAIPTLFQLENLGLKKDNLEILLTCTSCQNKEFFSSRKEKETTQRMLGVISLIN